MDTLKVVYEQEVSYRKAIGDIYSALKIHVDDIFHPAQFHSLISFNEIVIVLIRKQIDLHKKVFIDKVVDELLELIVYENIMYALFSKEEHMISHLEGNDYRIDKSKIRGSYEKFIESYEKYLTVSCLTLIEGTIKKYSDGGSE